jgi:protein NirF
MLLLLAGLLFGQQVWVVERERGALAVLEGGSVKEIGGLGNLNHATLKFRGGFAYVVSRDGYISLIDIKRKELIKKVSVGRSTIGLTFCDGKVAVANYDPPTVVLLTPDLEVLRTLETGSRNVGIKSWKGKLVFSLMDKDRVWVTTCDGRRLAEVKVSATPFDALISDGVYLVGFFGSGKVGLLDLETLSYRELYLGSSEEPVLKVPHFGTWGLRGRTAYVPAVGERKVYVVDLGSMRVVGSLDLPGLPVFAVLSPDGRYLAVNFSGDKEDFLALVDLKGGGRMRVRRLGRRILHLRFAEDGRYLYISSYYENKVKKVSVPDLGVVQEFAVPTPSGIFVGG